MSALVERLQSRPRLLVRDVERIVLQHIGEGRYAIGERLPSCEGLGREIGANKNTVSKAYRALAGRGYVSVSAGRGTFVTLRPPAGDEQAFISEIESLLDLVAEQAHAARISVEDLEGLTGRAIRRRYEHVAVKVGFVECNLTDAQTFSRELAEATRTPVEPLVLGDIVAGGEALTVATRCDVLAVSLAHLAEVERALAATSAARPEIVPLLTLPAPERLAEVARLAAETRLGIISETPDALNSLTALVHAFNSALRVDPVLANDPRLDEVLHGSDVLLVTEVVHQRRLAHLSAKRLIDAPFMLDPRSIEVFAARIAQHRGRTSPRRPARSGPGATTSTGSSARRAGKRSTAA